MPPSVTSDKELIVEGKSFFTQHSYLFTRNKTIIVSDPKKYNNNRVYCANATQFSAPALNCI